MEGDSFTASSFSVKQEVHLLRVGSREEDRDFEGKEDQEREWTNELYSEVLRAYVRLPYQAFTFDRQTCKESHHTRDDSVPVTIITVIMFCSHDLILLEKRKKQEV